MTDKEAASDKEDEVEASRAPLMDHLIELRGRLIRALIAVFVAFIGAVLLIAVAGALFPSRRRFLGR